MHDDLPSHGDGPAVAAPENELAKLEAAIELVATGMATRVALTNLRLADLLVEEAERRAAERNLRVRVRWPADDGPIGLVIETADGGRPRTVPRPTR
jgi:hypothetical protein